MRSSPDLAMTALLKHNDLIIKAKKENFGHVVLREGGGCSTRDQSCPHSAPLYLYLYLYLLVLRLLAQIYT